MGILWAHTGAMGYLYSRYRYMDSMYGYSVLHYSPPWC